MADVNHDRIVSHALRRLVDASFREKLRAVAPDGTRPIMAALLSDSLPDLLVRVHKAGRAANVIVPLSPAGRGYFVLAVHFSRHVDGEQPTSCRPVEVAPDITVGIFIARAIQDGGTGGKLVPYLVPDPADDASEVASAELVGVAE